ncbi:hypothetical protein ACH5RR_032575 [Cinchona calisaya]|uniref:DUF4283 domain-containing protein n=1 Tax=Cinchona calisaya TaxID=153742 RepID=A0ABD2YIH7_9GENT
MAEELAEILRKFDLSSREVSGPELVDIDVGEILANCKLSITGKFIFTMEKDKDRVLNGRPWIIDNQMLVLEPWTEDFEDKRNLLNFHQCGCKFGIYLYNGTVEKNVILDINNKEEQYGHWLRASSGKSPFQKKDHSRELTQKEQGNKVSCEVNKWEIKSLEGMNYRESKEGRTEKGIGKVSLSNGMKDVLNDSSITPSASRIQVINPSDSMTLSPYSDNDGSNSIGKLIEGERETTTEKVSKEQKMTEVVANKLGTVVEGNKTRDGLEDGEVIMEWCKTKLGNSSNKSKGIQKFRKLPGYVREPLKELPTNHLKLEELGKRKDIMSESSTEQVGGFEQSLKILKDGNFTKQRLLRIPSQVKVAVSTSNNGLNGKFGIGIAAWDWDMKPQKVWAMGERGK